AFTIATLPLQSCRMLPSRYRFHFGWSCQSVHFQCARLWTAIEADAASRAFRTLVLCWMHAVSVQFRQQFQAFWRTGFHAQSASLALFLVDQDFSPRLACHFHLIGTTCAAGRCSHFVFSQYS